jgi:hypothetical protein
MLKQIFNEIKESNQGLCIEDLAGQMNVELSALDGMLDTLVSLGRIIETSPSGVCNICPTSKQCNLPSKSKRTFILP